MIDPTLLRDNPDLIRQSLQARGGEIEAVDRAIVADDARRAAITEFETLRGEQNLFGKKVAAAKGEEKSALVADAKALAEKVKAAQANLQEAEANAKKALYALPNLVSEGVPAGGEENFHTLKTVGDKPSFDFPVRDHLDLAEALGIIDMDRGAKVSGSRFYFLVGAGALLENALMQRAIQLAVGEGFQLMMPPTLVRPEVMQGTGFLGEHASEVYYLPHDELYLTGTSEVALAGYHSDEIIDLSAGPLRYAGLSTCYRREAGSHGRDVRGIIRVHQFQKLEMFSYTSQGDAEAEHERLLGWQEQLLGELGLHYRVIDVAAGDLGSSAARKYDIEAWIASQGDYRELTSTSNCTTFQARRLGTRHRVEPDGNTEAVATLNGTLATTRWIVALLETHQQPDGSIRVPESLQPFVGQDTIRARGDQ
ncbi:serine--tRNA ligase [Pontimonas sp.]|uniref:serine--tRNA ligase n=1 Tax=Pontimonas sp. TaxID=2304492 RepID=UPI002870B2ED|nr:serine--tRNA ligase [Pontimonas sp.]MDR9396547.1 serine--tRNA ligase [Pontimonas sp.]MDR9434150.1 serine--tRNA ligase [Pontimonas sp.]